MRKRSVIYAILSVLSLATLITGLLFLDDKYDLYVYLSSGFVFIYALIYLLFGLPRLIVYFFYGVLTLLLAFFIPNDYRLIIVFVMTIIIVINPLSGFETFMNKRFKPGQTDTYELPLFGKYKTYNEYKKSMKHTYHFPQTRKLYTKKTYQYLRQFSAITLFTLLIFLLIFTTNDIIRIGGFSDINILLIYFQVVLSISVMVLAKKGFTSTFRVIRASVFPAIIYATILSSFPNYLKIIFIVFSGLAFIGLLITEVYFYTTRVTYESYDYTDQRNLEVHANALYEPFIYNEDKVLSVKLSIDVTKELFLKRKQELLIYLNFKKVMLTAYTCEKEMVHLYLEFYNKKSLNKVETKVSSLYKTNIKTTPLIDNYYEKTFLHNHEYIIQRALNLSHLLDELEIKESLIISTAMYFKDLADAKEILRHYQVNIIDNKTGYALIEVLINTKNIDYLIESKLRDLLLEMLIHGGVFVRVMVYY